MLREATIQRLKLVELMAVGEINQYVRTYVRDPWAAF
jgi:hypothetical protein